ncbi:MAG: endoflagellar protein [Candidatus Hydrogenedentota bacterium]|nr:MAG: endoflagellar protein [Candidatus Hydrogenedentota bacterium]
MIRVTRINDKEFWIASEQIESVEATPDTVVTLLSGKKVIVKESPEEIRRRIIEYRGMVIREGAKVVENSGKESSGPEEGDI